jgi:nucleolar protein 58
LDDLDKELNNYIMRCKEWYGWHFPEMSKIVQDNIAYCKTIKKMGYKTNAASIELADILPEDIEQKVKEAAEVSMGTEISEEDLSNITNLCDQVTHSSSSSSKMCLLLEKSSVNAKNLIKP